MRPEHIDSVISTIGSNFINLQTLQLRLEEHDIDVATPTSILFSNLRELNLQFSNGNVDRPFKKLLQLGWTSVRSLTLQYGSLTEEAVRAIGTNMPQLRKLVLHAVEFRCDHQGRRSVILKTISFINFIEFIFSVDTVIESAPTVVMLCGKQSLTCRI